MSVRDKVVAEVKELALAGLYFFVWIGMNENVEQSTNDTV